MSLNYKYITINGSGFNLDSFGDFRHQFVNSTTVPYSKSFLSLVSGKAQLTLSASVDFETYYCFDYAQCSIITSTLGVITADPDYIFLDGVNVPFVFDSGFFVFQAGRYVWIFKNSLITFPSSSPLVVAPFDRMIGFNYTFEITFSEYDGVRKFSNVNVYRNGSLFTDTSHFGATLSMVLLLDPSVGQSLLFDIPCALGFFPDMVSFDFSFLGNFSCVTKHVTFPTGVSIFTFRVLDRYFLNYVDSVLYAKSLGSDIDISQLFYKDPAVIDTTTSGYEFQIGILQDEITNQIGLKQLAQSSLSVAQTQLSEANTNLTICQSSKTTFEATIIANADKLATAIDEASTATGLAKVNETISTGLTNYYETEITRLTAIITTQQDVLDAKIASVESQNVTLKSLSKTNFDALVIPDTLTSLNGAGSEFIDGTLVNVEMRPYTYVVIRSFNALVADNNYTVIYDLLSDDGHSLSVPEALVTAVVPTVTAP